jgi:guanylate kinase
MMKRRESNMNQMMKTTTSSDIAPLLNFPEKGEILSGNKVIETETKYKDNVFRYRITFPKNVRRSDIPNILREFYNTSLFTINSVDHVVENHDYQTRTTRNNTVILGSMQITPLSLTNPVAKQLTALQDFDNEYEKMVMTSPETYFRVFAYRGFDGPAFRSKLFSFVSNMGENYGYCDDKSIYHRRASLVMPKIKITKAPEQAKMFYHTHPKRDEPSLSSADDYLLYFDMSHKPRNIRHFYTVMADRMDYFHVVPKPSKKKDYVKIDEDKFIAGLDAQIDEAGKRLDETMSNETYADDLLYCEKVTREVVKWLNKTYGKYFTITYKCHYKVKKNPEEPTGSDLHLEDAFIAKALKDLKTGTASWPDFGPKDKPQENYAYWHSKYFTMNKDVKGVGYMGLLPGDDRRLTHFLYSNYRGSEYTYDDILGILCISNDIKIRDAKIRDGKEVPSRIEDILDYLEIDNEEIREDIMLYDAVVAVDAYGSLSEAIGEEHNFILPIADFSIKSVEAMNLVRSGKKNLERAKYEIMVTLKEKMGKAVADALGKRNKELRTMKTPAAVYGQDGAAVSTVGINPPVQRTRRDFGMVLPKRVFENPELLLELLEEYKKPDKDLQVGQTNAYNIAIPVENSAVSFTIQGTGNVQIFVPSKGYPMPEDSDEAVLQAVRTLVEKLNTFDFNIDTSDIAFGTIAPMRNPNAGTIIAITGPVRSTKNKFIDSLSKRMNASVVTTITTKTLKESEKRPNIVEVSDDIFTKMEINGELAVVTESLAGYKRGFSRRDMQKGDYMLVDARIQDLHFLINAKPSVISFFLHPTNTEAMIESYLSEHVSPQEAKRVAGMIDDTLDAAEGEVEHIIEYDIERPAAGIEEVYNTIPKPNPMPKPIGSMMVSSNGEYYLRVKSNPVENPQKKNSIRIDESTNPEKKLMAVFTKPNGRTKTIHFGARGMSDYTQHKDKSRRKNYLARHGGMGEDWNDPMTAGALSRWILWGKPSLRDSFNDFKKRFNMEGVMAVTNTKMNPNHNPPWAVFIVGKVGDKYAATTRDDGRIGLPGGKVDAGESGKVAVMREATEEGWSFPKETNLTLIHQQDVEGNPIDWYMADTTPSKLSEYKEKHRGIKPILITEEELRNSRFGNENLPLHRKNPSHCPIEAEARRAANDPSFKHHKWYVKHHLDYVMAITKRMPKVMGNWDKQMGDMVWMHDYPKMMGKGQDLSVVNDLLTTHRGEDYAYQVVHQLHLMERLKKSDWDSLTEYSMVAANLSTADALAHYYGPFFQIYIDENPDMSMEEIKKSNRQKLAKDKLKLRAGPMKDGLDSIKFQYKGRKIKILGNEQIKKLIEKKNPMAPGYQSYSWTTEDWRSIKVNNKGEIDYKEKCGAEGTQTPDGSPRLCLPVEVVRSLMRTESGKDVIRTQARKKARAKKGERVPWHPRIKKIWKRVKEQSPKDNPPSKVIIVSGPSGSGKSTISKTIAKELGGTLVPTITTRSRRPKEKEGEDRIFVSKDEFKEMINNNEFVEYKQHKDGVFYGRRKTDMDDISIVEVSLKGMKEYKELYPDSFAVFLEPDKSPKEIEKRLLSRGGMSEANAKARASIIPKQVAAAKTMPYDLFVKSRTGKYSEVAKEIISQIPIANPGWRHGEAMDEEDDPFADQF